MTNAQAAAFYLKYMCAHNKNNLDLNKIVDDGYATQNLDLSAATNAAAASRESARTVLDQFINEHTLWPTRVAPTVQEFTDEFYAEVSNHEEQARATSVEELLGRWKNAASLDKAAAQSQKIRAQLGMPSDVMASCSL